MKKLMLVVGTTNFDDLITRIDNEEILKTFISYGYTKIVFQIGNGHYYPKNFEKFKELSVEIYKYKPTYEQDIKDSSFIIGHAGAGTILDVLQKNKPLLVVINDSLMGNHQNELFDIMCKENYIFGLKSPKDLQKNLGEILEKIEKGHLKQYPKPEKNMISKIINDLY